MTPPRLSALDASFLAVESPTAHMHVGWAAVFGAPAGAAPPSFEQLRDHVHRRLERAPRYRQRLAAVPLALRAPVWVDDERFDVGHHVRRAEGDDLWAIADELLSWPLDPGRPLWELVIADRLPDGRLGVVGKAHHCMVDGLAAVELASLLLDPTPDTVPAPLQPFNPAPAPSDGRLLADGLRDLVVDRARIAVAPLRLARSPRRLARAAQSAPAVVGALAGAARAAPATSLNVPTSPLRHLARAQRPLDDLRRIATRFRTTVNDVMLAVVAGALRTFLARRGDELQPLKAMVPVSVRQPRGGGELGNAISFMFVELPCHEPLAVARLLRIHRETRARKRAGQPEAAGAVLDAVGLAPPPVQHRVARLVAGARAFNLAVSNIPGPPLPLYMLGCRLEEAYPVVPIADHHAVSIGMTTVADRAFFGIYADREALPDADALAAALDRSVAELLVAVAAADRPRPRVRDRTPVELVGA